MSSPAIVFKSQFKVFDDTMQVRGENQTVSYGNFVNYMDREVTKNQKEIDKELFNNFMKEVGYTSGKNVIDYVGNQDKTNHLFDSKYMNLNSTQIQEKSLSFDKAQQNQSPIWQNIFSFDNQFLIDEGFLVEGKLDEQKVMKGTQDAMSHFIHKMNFNETVNWLGAIHYNTDNIHVHVALVEEISSRERIETGKFKGQLKAKVPSKVMRETKSIFANSLINRTNELKRIDELSRHLISEKVGHLTLGDQWNLLQDLNQLLKELPHNRSLWKYRNHLLKEQRPLIDTINQQLIKRYANKEYQEFLKALDDMDRLNQRIYGNKNSGQYTQNKIDALNARLGNQLLRNLNQLFPKKQWKQNRNTSILSNLRQLNYAVSQTASDIQKAFRESKQNELNKHLYRQLEYEKEHKNREQYQYEYKP